MPEAGRTRCGARLPVGRVGPKWKKSDGVDIYIYVYICTHAYINVDVGFYVRV